MTDRPTDSQDKQGKKAGVTASGDDKGFGFEPLAKPIGRRVLAKTGVAAPVLMSLMSRPAWGWACSPSGLVSGNVSGRDHSECNGQGCKPHFWKNHLAAWQGTGYSPGVCSHWQGNQCMEWSTYGTLFVDVFGFEPSVTADIGQSASLLDVMLEYEKHNSTSSYENHLVAALLNAAKAPYIYGATTTQIIALAQAVHTGSPYQGVTVTQHEFFYMIKSMNKAGDCFLNTYGNCQPGYVEFDNTCIPACKVGEKFDLNSGQCVPMEHWNPDVHSGVEDN